MKLTLRRDLGGYALPVLEKAEIDGLELDRPFVLFTGPNGSGKSAVMRGIRASIGLRGERSGYIDTPMRRHLTPEEAGNDPERLATHLMEMRGDTAVADHVPAAFSIRDLGWTGQATHLFDSRAASSMAKSASFDDDMAHHISLLAGGGSKVSHGQFVAKSWWEAIHWAAGVAELDDPWRGSRPSPARQFVRDHALGDAPPSQERWLFVDEPETAVDAEVLLVGLCILLRAAEIGRLRVFCASHSLLFAAGMTAHPKIQTVDMGRPRGWMATQEIALKVAADMGRIDDVGQDMLAKIRKTKRR